MSTKDNPQNEQLLSEFPPATPEAWRAAAEKLLKGAPFEKKLITRTHEGIDLQPIYTGSSRSGVSKEVPDPGIPGAYPYRRGSRAPVQAPQPWLIAQELPYPTYEELHAALEHDLERGQNVIVLPLDRASQLGHDPDQADASHVGCGGVSIASIAGFGKALDGMDLSQFPLIVEAGTAGALFLAIAAAHARKKKIPTDALRGCIGSDPLGALVREGNLPMPLEVYYDEMAVAAEWAEKNASRMCTIAVSTRHYASGGASAVEELAAAIGTGTEYVRSLVQRGVSPDAALRQVWFSFSVGTHFFMEIAKLRAARMLWANVASAFGVPAEAGAMNVHVRTSEFDVTRTDPYVNMLRFTTEALSGAIGGCQSMHVGFFDEAIRLPDEFSRRIARNVQIILQSESHLHRVVDPAGGSWFVEWLTETVADRAWKLFQEIEKQGGMSASLRKGHLQESIAASSARRDEALAYRKDVMVGVTTYANPAEIPLEDRPDDLDSVRARRAETLKRLRTVPERAAEPAVRERLSRILETGRDSIMNALIDAAAQGATIGEMHRAWRSRRQGEPVNATPIAPHRRSSAFEVLRAASHAYSVRTGHAPEVFLATMGPVAQYKARADFSAGFISAAGCIARMGTGYATPEEAVAAALDSGARALVICSTDETYPALVPALCALVKSRPTPPMIVLAGYPQDHVESFKRAGVEEFIHLRANALAVLRHMLQRMEVIA